MAVEIEASYKPCEDEPFMNDRQREYFKRKLLAWKDEILEESRETLASLQSDNEIIPTSRQGVVGDGPSMSCARATGNAS